jgi:hypothetical protein
VELGRNRDGRLDPGNCYRQSVFSDRKDLLRYAESRRDNWEAAMVLHDPSGQTSAADARERYDGFLKQVASDPQHSDRLHIELQTLKPDVAEQIDDYEARMRTLSGGEDAVASQRPIDPGIHKELGLLNAEVHRLLESTENWSAGALLVLETNERNSTKGFNFGLRAVNQESARAGRITALLIASVPEV